MTIHREGYKSLAITFAGLLALNILALLLINNPVWHRIILGASVIFFLLILQFFRSPAIRTAKNPAHVIAPADGKIVVIEETEEKEYLNEKRIQVSIFMSPVNVHVNRNPVSGMIKYFKYHPGKYLVAWHPKASTDNERTTLVYEMDNGLKILVRQIAGALARRIKCYVNECQAVEQGEEFGFIKFGSRVDVFLPLGTTIHAKIGDSTTAGKTVLAELNVS